MVRVVGRTEAPPMVTDFAFMSASLIGAGSTAVEAVEPELEVLCVLAVAAPPAARTKAPAARAAVVRVRIVIDLAPSMGVWNWPPMAGNVDRWLSFRAMSDEGDFAPWQC